MIHALVGTNSFLRTQKLAELTAEFAKKYGDQNIEHKSGDSVTVQELPQLLQGVSLFSINRLVVFRDLSVNKEVAEALMNQLENLSGETELIIIETSIDKRSSFYKSLKKLDGFIDCSEPNEGEILKWITQYVTDHGGNISAGDSRLLLSYVGIDQQRLAHEIQKLLAYNKEISSSSIKELINPQPQETVFQLIELALSDNKQRALEVLKALEDAFADPFQIANLLMWQIQVLAIVKSAGERSDAQIAKETKLNPYVVTKTKRLARSANSAKLRALLKEASELDITLKTTNSQPWRLLEATIMLL